MVKTVLNILAVAAVLSPAVGFAQAPKAATYITDEEVKTVNATPGVDRTIKVVDVGPENFAVGVIHRGPTGGAARGAAPAGGAARPAARSRRGSGRRRGRGGGAAGTVRRGVDGPRGRRRGRRHRARSADRGLPDHLRQRHARHRRQDRQRPEVGARRAR